MPEFTIGNYLAARLEQIGTRHYFMVPRGLQPGAARPTAGEQEPGADRLLQRAQRVLRRRSLCPGQRLHHSLGPRDLSCQYEMVKYVTCAAVRIVHPGDAPSMCEIRHP